MSYECSGCGKVHDELPRFFMSRWPQTRTGRRIHARDDRKSMCRTLSQCFVRCEIEVPLISGAAGSLGFICWVKVQPAAYRRLLAFRESEQTAPVFSDLFPGTVANSLTAIPNSFGTSVEFEVLAGDPTPYVRWVQPSTALARRIKTGATNKFWHEVASSALGRRA